MVHVQVPLFDHEFDALIRLSELDMRPIPWVLRWLLVQEAARRGLIDINATQEHSNEEAQSH